ncbi:ATP-binding protein [Xenorhabdus thuongxuanensis]|uniref:ATP-binding protein n=1 Tax=Xenorhabdus thuongxuanensis TaxID=1873484 RepID=A0A1Q5U3R8_9GAMM|nr:ATP-binding protein [Xenorhabdus thuongxuanensis]OKP07123.1 hypothetical protein Xentx_01727 [Xenorhabdus thuongxuanensis]
MTAFERLRQHMDTVTARRMGKTIRINGVPYPALEAQFIPEMGPVSGDGVSYVVFSSAYHPRRDDEVVVDGETRVVTRHQRFNHKPHIWVE